MCHTSVLHVSQRHHNRVLLRLLYKGSLKGLIRVGASIRLKTLAGQGFGFSGPGTF